MLKHGGFLLMVLLAYFVMPDGPWYREIGAATLIILASDWWEGTGLFRWLRWGRDRRWGRHD